MQNHALSIVLALTSALLAGCVSPPAMPPEPTTEMEIGGGALASTETGSQPVTVLGRSVLAKGTFPPVPGTSYQIKGYVFDRDNPKVKKAVVDNSFGIKLGDNNHFAFEGENTDMGMIRRFSTTLEKSTVRITSPFVQWGGGAVDTKTGLVRFYPTPGLPDVTDDVITKMTIELIKLPAADASTTSGTISAATIRENIAKNNAMLAALDFSKPTMSIEKAARENVYFEGLSKGDRCAVRVRFELKDGGYLEYNPRLFKL